MVLPLLPPAQNAAGNAPTAVTIGTTLNTMDSVGTQTVYTRANWQDSWTEVEYLHADEVVWCASPSMPTATLRWVYGIVSYQKKLEWEEILRKTSYPGLYVKIVLDMQPDGSGGHETKTWIGIIKVDQDAMGGAFRGWTPTRAKTAEIGTGEQTFTAYGIEVLLRDYQVRDSYWRQAGASVKVDRPLTFNRRGRKNRSANKVAGLHDFEPDLATAVHWSSKDVVEYVLGNHTPVDENDQTVFSLSLAANAPLFSGDRPEIRQDGKSALELLQESIPTNRLLSFRVYVDEAASDAITIDPFTLTANDVVPPPGNTDKITKNDRLKTITFEDDPSTLATVKLSSVDKFAQVVSQGRRRRSIGSFSFTESTLDIGWDEATLEQAYEAGDAAVADTPVEDARRADILARSAAKYNDVYRRFVIPSGWNGKVGNGENNGGAMSPLFPTKAGGNADTAYPVYLAEMFIENTLPLYERGEYEDDKIKDGTTSEDQLKVERRPLVAWKIPLSDAALPDEWINAERLGDLADQPNTYLGRSNRISIAIDIPPEDTAVELSVAGAPQHIIAAQDFAPNGRDNANELTGDEYRDMIVTLSLTDDRYARGVWPAVAPAGPDVAARLTLLAGDGYRKDYAAPGTVVDIVDGDLKRTTGGWIHDDENQLTFVAKMAHAWYSETRNTLHLSTSALTNELEIGDMITSVNTQDDAGAGAYAEINTVVTEIRVQWPYGTDANPSAPKMSIATQQGNLDALGFVEDTVDRAFEDAVAAGWSFWGDA